MIKAEGNRWVADAGYENVAVDTLYALAQRVGKQTVRLENWSACLVDVDVIVLDTFNTESCRKLVRLTKGNHCVAYSVSVDSKPFKAS